MRYSLACLTHMNAVYAMRLYKSSLWWTKPMSSCTRQWYSVYYNADTKKKSLSISPFDVYDTSALLNRTPDELCEIFWACYEWWSNDLRTEMNVMQEDWWSLSTFFLKKLSCFLSYSIVRCCVFVYCYIFQGSRLVLSNALLEVQLFVRCYLLVWYSIDALMCADAIFSAFYIFTLDQFRRNWCLICWLHVGGMTRNISIHMHTASELIFTINKSFHIVFYLISCVLCRY